MNMKYALLLSLSLAMVAHPSRAGGTLPPDISVSECSAPGGADQASLYYNASGGKPVLVARIDGVEQRFEGLYPVSAEDSEMLEPDHEIQYAFYARSTGGVPALVIFEGLPNGHNHIFNFIRLATPAKDRFIQFRCD